jgi:hypothetical protein
MQTGSNGMRRKKEMRGLHILESYLNAFCAGWEVYKESVQLLQSLEPATYQILHGQWKRWILLFRTIPIKEVSPANAWLWGFTKVNRPTYSEFRATVQNSGLRLGNDIFRKVDIMLSAYWFLLFPRERSVSLGIKRPPLLEGKCRYYYYYDY